jgi:N-acetylglucosaminyl-diphospho-decaprenol L-rhamnosyltransferase
VKFFASKMIDVSIIIVSYNTKSLLGNFFLSLRGLIEQSDSLSFEVIVVDNASNDGSAEALTKFSPLDLLITNKKNVGFGRANNQAMAQAKGSWILLLNTDAFLRTGRVSTIVEYMRMNNKVGIVGVHLVNSDGSLQPSCRYFPTPVRLFSAKFQLKRWLPWLRPLDDLNWSHDVPRECDWVPGCFYLVRRELIAEIGLFDSRYFLYYEEVDHCREAAKAGWKVVFHPAVSMVHLGGESAKSDGQLSAAGKQLSPLKIESEVLYMRKQFGVSGLTAYLGFEIVSAFAMLAKLALKRSDPARIERARDVLDECRLIKQVLFATQFGVRPTR